MSLSDKSPERAGAKKKSAAKSAARKSARKRAASQSAEDEAGESPNVVEDHAGEQERETAFGEELAWRGQPLEPFSVSRESLFHQQRLGAGAPDFDEVLRAAGNDAFLGDAIRILYLCSHLPEDWRLVRGNAILMQEAIDLWSEDHVTVEERPEAVRLAIQIFNLAWKQAPEQVSDGMGGSSGN